MYDDVLKNEYGFYTLKNLPSDEERESYYRAQYYQQAQGGYEITYTTQELEFLKAKLEQKHLLINAHLVPPPGANCMFLDVGCGEGFAVAFFKEKGFSVLGLDYSEAGVKRQNSDVVDDVIVGDIYSSVDQLVSAGKRFDVVNMDNVLEHVTEPLMLLRQINNLMTEKGIAIIKVPNDFSVLQKYFWEQGIIKTANWVAPLDHISYFNKDGLMNICKASGLECIDFLSSQLIELFALNRNTNYFERKETGKSCHLARVDMENFFHATSPDKTIELYRVLGEMGIGREIIGVFRKGM